MRPVADEEITQAILGGIRFKGAAKGSSPKQDKIQTKARKKQYITGSHGSASAKKKAEIRARRAARGKKKG